MCQDITEIGFVIMLK